MATTNNKLKIDQVYPQDAPQMVVVLDTDASFSNGKTIRGPKVASLVNAINAKTQEQSSPTRSKSYSTIKRTLSTGKIAAHSIEVGMGMRINSSDCLLSDKSHFRQRSKQDVLNGFDNNYTDDDFDEEPTTTSRQMTRSLGRNDFLRTKVYDDEYNPSTVSPSESILSPHQEIPVGKIESNPFFQQDRQCTDASPIKLSEDRGTSKSFSKSSTVSVYHLRSGSVGSRSGSMSEPMSIKMRIKLWSEKERKAKQQQMLTERRKSAHFPISSSVANELEPVHPLESDGSLSLDTTSQKTAQKQKSTSTSSLNVETHKERCNLCKDCEATETNIDSTTNDLITTDIKLEGTSSTLETQLSGGSVDDAVSPSVKVDNEVSSPKASPKRNPKRNSTDSSLDVPKGLSKLSSRLLSPRFRRKKRDSSAQEDEDKKKKIASRSSKKRKAFKSKLSSTNSDNLPDMKVQKPSSGDSLKHRSIDDDVFTFEEDSSQRTSSLSEKPRNEMPNVKKRSESQPVDPQQLSMSHIQTQVQGGASEGENLCVATKFLEDIVNSDDAVGPLPSVFVRSERNRQTKEARDRTISRDIREIIDSFGTEDIEEGNQPFTAVEKPSESSTLSVGSDAKPSASDSEIDVIRTSSPSGSCESSNDGKLHCTCTCRWFTYLLRLVTGVSLSELCTCHSM